MSFLWPLALWALLLVPAFVAAYVLILRRRKRHALRYAGLELVREALGRGHALRRHLPPLLMLLALALMLLAASRPVMTLTLPVQQQTVMLAMDVSGSMRATDVEPSRIEASQAAARNFLKALPPATRAGIVSFAGTASVVQAPTHNREDLLAAIDRFQLQRGTAIGSGLILSLATLLPDSGIDLSQLLYNHADNQPVGQDKARAEFKPVPPGSNASNAIILLTDGQRTTGPDSLEAAKLAAERGIRVYTIGIGTREGDTIGFEGWSMRVQLDEETLKRMAEMTLGEYFHADSALNLARVYESLNSRIGFETKQTEVSGLIAALAAALVTLASALSLAWHGRLP